MGMRNALVVKKESRALRLELVRHSPWQARIQLTADTTRPWPGTPQSLRSLIRIDGKNYRLMGAERNDTLPALAQTKLEITPTQTVYKFAGDGVEVSLTFTTPLLLHELEVLSWPVTYLTWSVRSVDGKNHAAQVYFDGSSEVAVNTSDQPVNWSRLQTNGLRALRMGSREQPMLQKSGYNVRIDWGYFYVATPAFEDVRQAANDRARTREEFENGG